MAIDRVWHKPKGSKRRMLRWRVRIRTTLTDGTPYNFSSYYDTREIAEDIHDKVWRDVKTGKVQKRVEALAKMVNAPTISGLLRSYHTKVAEVRHKTGGKTAEKSRCLSTIPKAIIIANEGYGRDGDDNLTWFGEGTKNDPARHGENGTTILVPFGMLHAHTVRRKEIEEYIAARRKAGVTDGSIGRELDILRDAYNRWEALVDGTFLWKGAAPSNPVLTLTKEKKPAKAAERERRLTTEEREKLLALAAKHRNPEMGVVVVLGISAAMRLSEIVRLEWRNVDLESRVVRLPDTKNGRKRYVALPPLAVDALQRLERVDERVVHYTAEGVKANWARMRNKVAPDIHFHDLRHEAISSLVEAGLNSITVAAMTGTADIDHLEGRHFEKQDAKVTAKALGAGSSLTTGQIAATAGHRTRRMTKAYHSPDPATLAKGFDVGAQGGGVNPIQVRQENGETIVTIGGVEARGRDVAQAMALAKEMLSVLDG